VKTRLMAVILVLTMTAACTPTAATPTTGSTVGSQATSAKAASDTTVLRFAVSGMDENRYDSLIEAFEAENAGVRIKTVSIETVLGTGLPNAAWPDDAYLRLATAADVFDVVATRTAVQQGAVLELSALMASDPTLSQASFYPGLLESVQWEGGTWSLPTEATYSLLYYNQSLLDAAGLPYPQAGWSWDDFLATARSLTIESGGTVTQWGFVQTTFDPVALVQAYAGSLINAEADPPVAKFDSAAVIAGVKWFTDLFVVHKVVPYDAQRQMAFDQGPMTFGTDSRLIAEGQAAMWLGTGGSVLRASGRGGQEMTLGVVPLPVSNINQRSTPAEVSGLTISSGTSKANLAWKWISYLAQQQARQMARGWRGNLTSTAVPAMPAVAAAVGFWDGLDESTAEALRYAVEHAFVDNSEGTGYSTFVQAVRSVIESGTPVETALAGAQATAELEIETAVAARPTPVSNLAVAEQEEQALEAGAIVIQFGSSTALFGEQTLTTLADQFHQEHPNIIVELKSPEMFRGSLGLADMAAEYDCFQASPDLSSEDDLAAILSMDPFLEADPAIKANDFYPSLLKQFTYQGQTWGLPGSATISLITYNKALFDAAGVPYPSVDWTLSDFLEMAVALTQGDGDTKQYGYVPAFSAINDLVILLDRLGATPYDDSVDPPQLRLTDPKVVEAVRWYANLTTRYGVAPVPQTTTGRMPGRSQSMDLIFQGRAAMWTGSGFEFGQRGGTGMGMGMGMGMGLGAGGGGGVMAAPVPAEPSAGAEVGTPPAEGTPALVAESTTGVVPYPAGANSAEGSGFQSVTGYFVSSNTEYRQACWQWITFLTEQPNLSTGLPGRISVAQSNAYRQLVGNEQADAYLASVSAGSQASFFQQLSNSAGWLSMGLTFLSEAYDEIISGEATVEEALVEAQIKVDSFRSCVIANEGTYNPQVIQSCLGEIR